MRRPFTTIVIVVTLIAIVTSFTWAMYEQTTIHYSDMQLNAIEATRTLLRGTDSGDILLLDVYMPNMNDHSPTISTRSYILGELYTATLDELRTDFLILYEMGAGPLEDRIRVLRFSDENLLDFHQKMPRARILHLGTPEWEEKVNEIETR